MLDALDFQDVLAAIERWRPDPQCLAAGDEHVVLARRCYAGALSDQQITRRILDLIGVSMDIDTEPDVVAVALARHCAALEMPLHHIIAVLAYLAVQVPLWPDADELAEIAIAAVRGCSA